ncbi:protein kinase, partial [Streptomyces sp. NPDC127110]|uniref:serine/threonine-protein kinase n=1 Tax=Streptomyces sp. NPDC127110 TaxID=3345362 RepID=UPI00363D235A
MQGWRLDDRYDMHTWLGEGGSGEVWEATDTHMERSVAVKLVRIRASLDQGEAEARFLREIRAAAGLNHVHVVTVHDCGEAVIPGARLLYLVMERVDGKNLAEVFGTGEPLPWYDVVHWGHQIAQALASAHSKGIVHRDVKPANVLLTGTGVVKLADFGVAKLLDDLVQGNWTLPGNPVGTPAYMSPEQAGGDGRLDHRSDLYSLGCLLYEGLSGQPPFRGVGDAVKRRHIQELPRPLADAAPGVPPAVAAVVMRLLAKDPARRVPDAATLAHALSRALEAHREERAETAAVLEEARKGSSLLRARAEASARAVKEEADRYADAVRAGAVPAALEARRAADRYAEHRRREADEQAVARLAEAEHAAAGILEAARAERLRLLLEARLRDPGQAPWWRPAPSRAARPDGGAPPDRPAPAGTPGVRRAEARAGYAPAPPQRPLLMLPPGPVRPCLEAGPPGPAPPPVPVLSPEFMAALRAYTAFAPETRGGGAPRRGGGAARGGGGAGGGGASAAGGGWGGGA